MIFYLVFSFIFGGSSLWVPLAPSPDKPYFDTLEACQARGALVLEAMQAAYPEDKTMMFRCQEVPK